jgi:hypothetical protein
MEDCTKLVAKTEGKEGSKKYTFVIQTTFGRDYILQAATEPGIPLRFKRTCCWRATYPLSLSLFVCVRVRACVMCDVLVLMICGLGCRANEVDGGNQQLPWHGH